MSKRTVVLVVLDGWGIGRNDPTNPIYTANPKTINWIKSRYLSASLQASGIAVGLPWSEEGNSEVGHLTIGAGKILYQHFPRITLAIKNGEFFKNKALRGAFDHAVKNKSAVNLVGLLSQGHVHASMDHLLALIDFAKSFKIPLIKLHLFSDGKDSSPRSFLPLVKKINSSVKIASISGRYFAMDRDRHWDRTYEAYKALLGKKEVSESTDKYIDYQYNRGLDDAYLAPACIGREPQPIKDNEAVIFFNYREDSMRQIAAPFVLPSFKEFKTFPLKNLYVATMTQYSDQFRSQVAFPPEKIEWPLGKVLAENGKYQLRVAETEKYAHVTYFFNGLQDKPFRNEYRILIPSRNVIHHDEHPEMMVHEVANRVIQALEEGEMDFILANFANPDMIAHTGNFEAAVAAIGVVDEQVEKITRAALARNAVLIITSDHGNVERMINPVTGLAETKHDISPVPFYLIGKRYERVKNETAIRQIENETVGMLADVAPTVLELMGIKKPPEMTGWSLLNRLS